MGFRGRRHFGDRGGPAVPIHGPKGYAAVASFVGPADPADPRERPPPDDRPQGACAAPPAAARLQRGKPRPPSVRERDALDYPASGVTDQGIVRRPPSAGRIGAAASYDETGVFPGARQGHQLGEHRGRSGRHARLADPARGHDRRNLRQWGTATSRRCSRVRSQGAERAIRGGRRCSPLLTSDRVWSVEIGKRVQLNPVLQAGSVSWIRAGPAASFDNSATLCFGYALPVALSPLAIVDDGPRPVVAPDLAVLDLGHGTILPFPGALPVRMAGLGGRAAVSRRRIAPSSCAKRGGPRAAPSYASRRYPRSKP